jgi:sulfur carrier protein
MNISINGEPFTTNQTVLVQIINEFGATPPFAIAVNGDFVPKSTYQECIISEGDLVDIVSPIFGG